MGEPAGAAGTEESVHILVKSRRPLPMPRTPAGPYRTPDRERELQAEVARLQAELRVLHGRSPREVRVADLLHGQPPRG